MDSSAWIGLLRNEQTPVTQYLERAIHVDAPLVVAGVAVTELLRGCSSEPEADKLRSALLAWPHVEPTFPTTYEAAAGLYRAARRQGLTVRSTIDCLLAAMALENGLTILHSDRDFDALARISNLQLVTP